MSGLRSWVFPLLVGPVLAGCTAEAPPPAPVVPVAQPAPPPAPPPPPDECFRKAAPSSGAGVAFVAPNVQEKRLANGVRVLVVERDELHVVEIDLAFDR